MLPDELLGKRIGIFGFGVNNRALAAWLVRNGADQVTVVDERPNVESDVAMANLRVPVIVGPDAFDRAIDFDFVFRTPGLHPDHAALERLRTAGARITSQTDLFLELCPARTIGITGTKGKGTTASLLAHLLGPRIENRELRMNETSIPNSQFPIHRRLFLAGNIGKDPFEFLDQLTKDDFVILELSSAQLADVQHSPNLALVLDVSADHLDYHATFHEYLEAKQRIVRFQLPSDVALLNLDSAASLAFALVATGSVLYYSTEKSVDAGGYIVGQQLYYRDPRTEAPVEVVGIDELPLRGPHNRTNALAAMTAALMLGIEPSEIRTQLQTFKGLPHRLETVGTKRGVFWVNDSYATVPQSTIQALRSFTEPLLLIVGGSSKGLAYQALGEAIARHGPKALVVIGQTGPEIAASAREAGYPDERIVDAHDLPSAVQTCARRAEPGEVVVLSPGSASFDQFYNATQRGEQFKRLVEELKDEQS